MNYLLFPGRHHLVTNFQMKYLKELAAKYDGAVIVWAVTSADHTGTQRNPIAGARRLGMIEAVAAAETLPSEVYLIANKRPNPQFAHYLIEDIRTQTSGRVDMVPDNTVVVCSTPGVIDDYQSLGFKVETAELDTPELRPWDVVQRIITAGSEWQDDKEVRLLMHPAAFAYYTRYGLASLIQSIYADPLVSSDDGDITVTRDYATYRAAFEDNAWRKVQDFAIYVQPGRILDVGCATGQTIKLLGEQSELFESDFYGVEVARPLYEICQQRKTNGEFSDTNVYFYQRNIMQSELFKPSSLDTIITMALTHEIESYLGHSELERFLERAYQMLAPGGVYINYDVVGPDDRDKEVYMALNSVDGDNPEDLREDLDGEELARFLSSLSSAARFKRFVKDFRHEEGDGMAARYEVVDGREYAVTRFADAMEFLAKKEYVDSWKSEMHERFCFYSHQEWCEALEKVGFVMKDGTRAVQNPWLIENRFTPAAELYEKDDAGILHQINYPATNTLLIASKPEV